MKEYQINVIAGTKVLADMVETVKDATYQATTEIKPVPPGPLPDITAGGVEKKMDVGSGIWTWKGVVLKNPNGTDGIPEGYTGALWFDKVNWSISKMQALPKGVGVASSYISLNNSEAVSALSIEEELFGKTDVIGATGVGEANYKDCFKIFSNSTLTLVLDTKHVSTINAKYLIYYAAVAGRLIVNKYSKTGSTFVRTYSSPALYVKLGFNMIPLNPDLQTLSVGEHIGIIQDTATITSRVGSILGTPIGYSVWRVNSNVTTSPITLTETLTNRFGLFLVTNDPTITQVKGRISKIITDNLFDKSLLISNIYIDNLGRISSGTGWRMFGLDVTLYPDGTKFSFGNATIDQDTGYAAFYNGSNLLQNIGSFSPITGKTVTKPTGATILYFDVSRPADTTKFPNGDNYAKLILNVGEDLIPFTPHEIVSEIDGTPVGGSFGGDSSFDQSLNKTDNVQFASISASTLILNLPTTDVGLAVGRAWIDTLNGNVIKVKS